MTTHLSGGKVYIYVAGDTWANISSFPFTMRGEGGLPDAFIAKFDAGNVNPALWVRQVGPGAACRLNGQEYGNTAAVDATGKIFLSGVTDQTTISFLTEGTGCTPNFFRSYDSDGNLITPESQELWGDGYSYETLATVIDQSGNLWSAGSIKPDTVAHDSCVFTSTYINDTTYQKKNFTALATAGSDTGTDLAFDDATGALFLTSIYDYTGTADTHIARFDTTNGNALVWEKLLGVAETDIGAATA